MTERKTVERLTRDILDADEYRSCTQKSAKSIAARLVSMGWQPSIVHQCCEDAEKYRPRVVETIDQLASLPDGVWIRDRAGDIGIKNDWPLDLAVHYPILGHWKTNATIPVPATVLYVPQEVK